MSWNCMATSCHTRQVIPTTSPPGSHQARDPAVLVLGAAVLDVGELLVEPLGECARSTVGDRDVEGLPRQTPDRGDDRGGAAGEDLAHRTVLDPCEQPAQRDVALLDRHPVSREEGEDGGASDPLETRAGDGGGAHDAVGADEI